MKRVPLHRITRVLAARLLTHSIQGEAMKKTYERPAIVHTEKLEARAVVCSKAVDAQCGAGPIQS